MTFIWKHFKKKIKKILINQKNVSDIIPVGVIYAVFFTVFPAVLNQNFLVWQSEVPQVEHFLWVDPDSAHSQLAMLP